MTAAERDAVAIARAIRDLPAERRLGALALALRMAIEGGWLDAPRERAVRGEP